MKGLRRIDQRREETKGDAQWLEGQPKTSKDKVKADFHEITTGMHAMRARMTRVELLLEEQKARDEIVLDGITVLLSRQDRVAERLARVEETIRKLAAA